MIVLTAGCTSLAQLMRADQGASTPSLAASPSSGQARPGDRPQLALCSSPARQTR